jgi:hypothetical protein
MSDTNGFFTKARIFNVEVLYYTFLALIQLTVTIYTILYTPIKNINSTMDKQITKSKTEYSCA